MHRRHALTDAQWAKIEPLLKGRVGRPSKAGDRLFIDAVLFWAKTGVPWRDLPPHFGPWKTVFNRFDRWSSTGRWQRLFGEVQTEIDPDGSLLDATIVRAHQHAAGAKGGAMKRLAAREEGGQPRSTPSWTPLGNRSTWS